MAISDTEQRYRDFFQIPLQTLLADHQLSSVEEGDGGRWHGFSSGFSGVLYRIAFLQGKKPAVRVVIDRNDRDWNKRLFDGLSERRETIESAISGSLEWDYIDGRRRCIISAVRDGNIAASRETWTEMQDWMVDRLLAFKRAFTPHLQELAE